MVRRALPKLLRNYLLAVTQGSLSAATPAANPATAQALLHRIWQAVTLVIHPEVAQAGTGPLVPLVLGGLQRPQPTTSTRADMVQVSSIEVPAFPSL